MKKIKDRLTLRIYPAIREQVHKTSLAIDKSINTTAERLINNSLIRMNENERIYFEMQYLDFDDRFGFKSEHENNESKEKKNVYRFTAINKNNGNFICHCVTTNKTTEFKFSEFFYKPVFII